ncbi:conserved unknown protein [Ectocarpus siliculosus]|uniref:BZIP domain-containing protein n=1 Tax=Ectocarpus siliculosus TaxID=2880 RepID=D7G5J2_ECTSI|nr:conserved unknown protein [Ectocarpus siliculosus]|eukprot:CBJ27315.1 conserved unknown protein [Ectocarpus siliculosus]
MELSPRHEQPVLPAGGSAPPAQYNPSWDAPGNTLTSLLPMGKPPRAGAESDQPLAQQGKRPLGSTAADAMESKRLKRLEKNRESARECRRRKKEHKEKLEAHLASLEEENLNLRLQLRVGDEAEDAENAEILEIKKGLHDQVARGVGEGQILQTMDLLTERFADYGSAHTSAADFHLAQLSRLLLPTLTTRVCMHAVLQAGGSGAGAKTERVAGTVTPGAPPAASADGRSENAKGGFASGLSASSSSSGDAPGGDSLLASVPEDVGEGARQETAAAAAAAAAGLGGSASATVDMWTSLVALLEATPEQQAVMHNQAGAIADLARDLEGTEEIVERLRLFLADRNQTLDGEMAAIQSAKFVLWVSKNKACVHMLNQLWDKLHGVDQSPAA